MMSKGALEQEGCLYIRSRLKSTKGKTERMGFIDLERRTIGSIFGALW